MASIKWNFLKLLSIATAFLFFSMLVVHANIREFCDENSIDISDLSDEAKKMGMSTEELVALMKRDMKSRPSAGKQSHLSSEGVIADISKNRLPDSSTSSSFSSGKSAKKLKKGGKGNKVTRSQLRELKENNSPMLYIPEGTDPASALRAIRTQRAMEDLYAEHFNKVISSKNAGDISPKQPGQEFVAKPVGRVSKSSAPKKYRKVNKKKRPRRAKKRRYRRRKAPRKLGTPIAPMMPMPAQFRQDFGPPPMSYPNQEQFSAQELDRNLQNNQMNNELTWTPLIICAIVGIFVIFCIVAGLCFCTLKSKNPTNKTQQQLPQQAQAGFMGGREQGAIPPNQNIGIVGYAAIPTRGPPHL